VKDFHRSATFETLSVLSAPITSYLKLKFKNTSYFGNFLFADYIISLSGDSCRLPSNKINTNQKMISGSPIQGGKKTETVIDIH